MKELYLKYNTPKTYRELHKNKELIPCLRNVDKYCAEGIVIKDMIEV